MANAQLVDGVLGQRRSLVQVLLKPYRIIDYKVDREVHNIETGIHQTVLFEEDTCRKFYWAVVPEKMLQFETLLVENGYEASATGYAKDSLMLAMKSLKSGKATLFIASISKELEGKRDASGQIVVVKPKVQTENLPLLQQAVLEEEQKPKEKRKKDPKRHWVGTEQGTTSILGWEK